MPKINQKQDIKISSLLKSNNNMTFILMSDLHLIICIVNESEIRKQVNFPIGIESKCGKHLMIDQSSE